MKYNRLRDLFIYRMTHDSETHDRRKKDFHQAIFGYNSDEDIVHAEEIGKIRGIPIHLKKTYPIWDDIDMDMVLDCFDKAVKDLQKEEKT